MVREKDAKKGNDHNKNKYPNLKMTSGEKIMQLVRGDIDVVGLTSDADTDGSEDSSPKSSVVSSSEHEGFEVVSERVKNDAGKENSTNISTHSVSSNDEEGIEVGYPARQLF